MLQFSAISAEWPIATALAPSARHLATSPPLRMPPATTRSISSARPTSSSARRASGIAAISGMPVSSAATCGPGPGAALGAVQVDDVRAALGRHPDVVVDAGRAQLQLDRDLVVGGLADLLDLQRQVVGAQPVRVAGRGALVDPGRERAHLGHLLGHLLAHQVAAQADLAALPDEELDRRRRASGGAG